MYTYLHVTEVRQAGALGCPAVYCFRSRPPGRGLGSLLGGVLGPSKANILRNMQQKRKKTCSYFQGVHFSQKKNVKNVDR